MELSLTKRIHKDAHDCTRLRTTPSKVWRPTEVRAPDSPGRASNDDGVRDGFRDSSFETPVWVYWLTLQNNRTQLEDVGVTRLVGTDEASEPCIAEMQR